MSRNAADLIIRAHTAGARSELGKLDRSFGQLVDGNRRAKAALKDSFLPAAAGFALATAAMIRSTKAASDYAETLSKTQVIYGDNTAALEKWARGAASAFGMSQTAALDAASSFGAVFQAAGKSPAQAMKMSQALAQLSGDLASFYNTRPDEAFSALQSGLAGETEPLRRYNVYLADMTLRQRAVKLGLVATTKQALTPQVKALAVYAEVLRQTRKPQGDFLRTSDGMANSIRTMNAQLENTKIVVGTAFYQALRPLLPWLKAVGDFAAAHPNMFRWLIGGLMGLAGIVAGSAGLVYLVEAIGAIVAILGAIVSAPVAAVIAAIAGAVLLLAAAFVGLYDNSETFRQLVDFILENVPKVARWIGQTAAQAFGWLRDRLGEAGIKLDNFRQIAGLIGMAMAPGLTAIFYLIDKLRELEGKYHVIDAIRVAWILAGRAAGAAGDTLRGYVAALGTLTARAVSAVSGAWEAVTSNASSALAWIGKVIAKLGELRATAANDLAGAFDSITRAIGRVIDKVTQLIAKLGGIRFPSLPSWIPRSVLPTSYTPALAAGGTSRYSPTSSASRSSSGIGSVVNVTVQAIDPEGAARAVRRVLLDHDRRQGRIGRYA